MNRKQDTNHLLLSFICLVSTMDASISYAGGTDSKPPNFVLIYADDLGYADLSCYGNGYHETPHIDRLMKDGIRFTQAYSDAPLCAPSRIALLTGRHSARAGCYDVFPERILKGVDPDLIDFIPPENTWDLPAGIRILPEYLKQIGYRTGFFGKWHVGPVKPNTRGFDEFVNIRTTSHVDVREGFIARSHSYPPPTQKSSTNWGSVSTNGASKRMRRCLNTRATTQCLCRGQMRQWSITNDMKQGILNELS